MVPVPGKCRSQRSAYLVELSSRIHSKYKCRAFDVLKFQNPIGQTIAAIVASALAEDILVFRKSDICNIYPRFNANSRSFAHVYQRQRYMVGCAVELQGITLMGATDGHK